MPGEDRTKRRDSSLIARNHLPCPDFTRKTIDDGLPFARGDTAVDAAIGDDFDMMLGEADEEQHGIALGRVGRDPRSERRSVRGAAPPRPSGEAGVSRSPRGVSSRSASSARKMANSASSTSPVLDQGSSSQARKPARNAPIVASAKPVTRYSPARRAMTATSSARDCCSAAAMAASMRSRACSLIMPEASYPLLPYHSATGTTTPERTTATGEPSTGPSAA
jgi:hypothetical protein